MSFIYVEILVLYKTIHLISSLYAGTTTLKFILDLSLIFGNSSSFPVFGSKKYFSFLLRVTTAYCLDVDIKKIQTLNKYRR